MIEHVSSNGLDEVFQSAYKNFHSTETALVKVYNDILVDIDKNRTIILLLLDLSAAFDTVEHEILLLASHFGISDVALSWVGSYLSNPVRTTQRCRSAAAVHFYGCTALKRLKSSARESLKQRTSHFVHCESAAKFCHAKAVVKQRCWPLLKSCNET